jgi:cobalt-zinc-cadmium resistance protein CzcA
MLGSLLFALLAAPVLSGLLMRSKKTEKEYRDVLLVRILKAPYERLIRSLVRHRVWAVALAIALLVIGGTVFPLLGSEFTPSLREGTIVARLTMAPSISLKESTRVTMLAEARLLKIPEVQEVISRIGRGEVGAHTDPVNSAEMYLILKPENERDTGRTQEDIEEAVREKLENLPGVLVSLTQPIEMTVDELLEGVRAELAVKLFGEDLDTLKSKADEIAATVSQVSGAADVQVDQISGTPQLVIRVDRQAIARYGVNVADVQEIIRAAVGGSTAGQIFDGVKRFDIRVRFPEEDRKNA